MYGQDPWPACGHANRLGAGMPTSSRPTGADSRNSAVVVAEVSHRSSPTRRRERFHLGPERAAALGRALAGEGREAVVLATCNRTEIYLTGTDAADTGLRAACALAEVGGCAVDPGERLRPLQRSRRAPPVSRGRGARVDRARRHACRRPGAPSSQRGEGRAARPARCSIACSRARHERPSACAHRPRSHRARRRFRRSRSRPPRPSRPRSPTAACSSWALEGWLASPRSAPGRAVATTSPSSTGPLRGRMISRSASGGAPPPSIVSPRSWQRPRW